MAVNPLPGNFINYRLTTGSIIGGAPPLVPTDTNLPLNQDGTPNFPLRTRFYWPEHYVNRPPGFEECPPYTEEWNTDERGNDQVTRNFIGPWHLAQTFRIWALGYPLVVPVDPNDPQHVNGYVIERFLPDQHPRAPWLYASRARILGDGAYVSDPFQRILDVNGNIVTNPEGPDAFAGAAVQPEMIYFVENGPVQQGMNFDPAFIKFRPGVCRVEVTYTTRPYIVKSDGDKFNFFQGSEMCRWVERNDDPATEALPLNNVASGALRFTEGPYGPDNFGHPGQVIPEAGVLLLKTSQVTYTMHEWPFRPTVAIDTCLGTINSANFDGTQVCPWWQTYPPGVLLLKNYKVSWRRNVIGGVNWTIRLFMFYRRTGWNKFPARDGNFYAATFKDSGQPVYPSSDFNAIFGVPVKPPPIQ